MPFDAPEAANSFMYPEPEIAVAFDEDMDPADAELILTNAGITNILETNWLRTPNIFRATSPTDSGTELLNLANTLAMNAQVRWASTGFRVLGELASNSCSRTLTSWNDPEYSESWAHQMTNVEPAWEICAGEPSVVVAVLDDGVDFHPDMWEAQVAIGSPPQFSGPRGNFLEGIDCTGECGSVLEPCSQTCPGLPLVPCDRHGSLVTGVISATANNGQGSIGVAPGVSILPIRVGHYTTDDPTGATRFCKNHVLSEYRVADAIDFAAAAGARVTNMSWQTGADFSSVTEAYIRTYWNDGVIHFNSSGNDGLGDPQPPGGSPVPSVTIGPVNSVAALDQSGVKTEFSSYGPGLDFAAPGEFIFLVDRSNDWKDNFDSIGFRLSDCNPDVDVDCCDPQEPDCYGGLYLKEEGTSYAAPYVAGIAALGIAVQPDLQARKIESILIETADDLGDPGYDEVYGNGRPNAQKFLTYLRDLVFRDGFEDGDTSEWSTVE